MSQLILNEEKAATINGLNPSVEVCDSTGRLIGYLISKEKYEQFVYAWAKQQVSDEELRRAAQQTGGCSLQEVLTKLPQA